MDTKNFSKYAEPFNQVVHDQINKSHSKQLYSIPVGKRFTHYTQSDCNKFYYDGVTQKSQRKAGIGYGKKFEFKPTISQGFNPGPNRYERKSEFDGNQIEKVHQFQLNREQIVFGQNKPQMKTPGPGQYFEDDFFGDKTQCKYSMRKKQKNLFWLINKQNIAPGTGKYEEINNMDKKGKYKVAKHKNSKATKIDPPTTDRFYEYRKICCHSESPGPQLYDFESTNKTGKFKNYKMKSTEGGRFSQFSKSDPFFSKSRNPGPGHYRALSEFGDVENPVVMKKSNKSTIVSRNNTRPITTEGNIGHKINTISPCKEEKVGTREYNLKLIEKYQQFLKA